MEKYSMRIYLFYMFRHKRDLFLNIIFHSQSIQRNNLKYLGHSQTHIIQKLRYFKKLYQINFFVFWNKRPVSKRTVLVKTQHFTIFFFQFTQQDNPKRKTITIRLKFDRTTEHMFHALSTSKHHPSSDESSTALSI